MRIAASHPALPGHFPGRPVVPGVGVVGAVATALPQHLGTGLHISGFPVVKFHAPLLPEREFEIAFNPKTPGQMAFEVRADGEILATGTLTYDAVDPAS